MSKELSFENAMKRLEEIVGALEKSETSLNESIKLFEEGTKLTAFCSKTLDEAQQKITLLTKE